MAVGIFPRHFLTVSESYSVKSHSPHQWWGLYFWKNSGFGAVDRQVSPDPGHILGVGGVFFQVFHDVIHIHHRVHREAVSLLHLGNGGLFALALFLPVHHDEGRSDLHTLQVGQDAHALPDGGPGWRCRR